MSESEKTRKELIDSIFTQFKNNQKYNIALRRAAEEAYQNEMVDTNMEIIAVLEVAKEYEHYDSDEEKQATLDHCEWDSKKQWITNKMTEWLESE